MIGSGARYASANASAVPWTVTTKRSAEASPAPSPMADWFNISLPLSRERMRLGAERRHRLVQR